MNRVPVLLLAYRLHVGGNERDLSKLARALRADRFEPHVAAFHVDGDRRAELEAAGIPILHLPVTSFRNYTALAGAVKLRSYLRKNHIQVVHAFDTPTSIYAVPLGRLFGVPAVVSNHCYFRDLVPPPNYHGLRIVDRLAHRIVVNSFALREHLIRDYAIPQDRIFVSHNGVETDQFFPAAEPRPSFLDGASLVIGSLCVLREEKRLDVLLKAFARLQPIDPRMRLLIVGDGDMREKWMALRDALGLQQSCHFELTTTGVPRWLRCMDIFVLPSRSEGFPNTVLEAMACGCAVAASKVGGVPELIDHGRNGLLFAPADEDDLKAQLEILIGNAHQRLQMGAAAAAHAAGRFSMEITARRVEAFYESLLVKGNHPR
jgi:glycosyltransferase involved in cell wall biosynthesis